ncbi:ABC transporter permease [Marinisporobacter balticus]|uniref:ABC-type lipoprotein release transport system permease subunit n=1 Tax=Marinisporobacter balticus TaxID=2018667 RepID=A0A4V2SBB3_9FIRM|nr:ABC transporter permease [Marinisporobacter balticus]TCO74810.1 ABC-type lipoprotein release transport system permease subunit [Marinisporobacter balticus]
MNNWDLLKMGFHNLWRKKTRTFLTVLGVIIGTCSIVVMMSIGIANDQGTKEWIESMGDLSIIEVYSSGRYGDMDSRNSKKQVKLDDQGIEKLEKIDGVKAVMPIKEMRLKVAAGKMIGNVNVIGIKPEVMEAFDFKVQEGRLLTSTDKETLVFGTEVADRFYDPRSRNRYDRDPNAPKVNLISSKLMLSSDNNYGEKKRNQRNQRDDDYKPPKPHKVKGVGLLAQSGREQDWNAYMNITALEKIIKEDQDARHEKRRRSDNEDQYEQVKVKVIDIQRVEEIQEKIKAMGLDASSLTEWLKSMREQMKKSQMMLGGIGAVSLLVAAIGITNTMIMSIYERTREIGVMKVIGANLVDIKRLFLFEAAMIGFVGGILGITLSYGLSFALNKFGEGSMEGMDMMMGGMSGSAGMSIIPIELALGGVAFATVIGIISGYLPARRAMNLSALEAIKTE